MLQTSALAVTGTNSEAYFCTEPNHHCFQTPNGLITYRRWHNHLYCIGGLIGKKEALLRDFLQWSAQHHYTITFFNLTQQDASLLQGYGFSSNKWGEEALIPLKDWSWAGQDFIWVRRQHNYITRQKIIMTEERPTAALMQQLHEIDITSLATRAQTKEWGFLQSSLQPQVWGQRRLFVARSAEKLEGFVVALPYDSGQGWLLDLFRHHQQAPKGVVPFLMVEIINQLQREGCTTVSLAMIPGRGCQTTQSRLLRTLFTKIMPRLPLLFDAAGIEHYKSRFRPTYSDRFICSYPKVSLTGVLGASHLIGIFRINLLKVLKHWRQQRSRGARISTTSKIQIG